MELKEQKISMLNNLIANETLQIFQHQMFIDAADAGTTGNDTADQAIQRQAVNARAVVAACGRRLDVYAKALADIQALT